MLLFSMATQSVAPQVLPPQSSSGYPMEKLHVGTAVGFTTPNSDFHSVGRRVNCGQKQTTLPYLM
jgi:hypothetical protein